MEIILLLVRIILAGIFALAGIGKLLDLKGSKKAVEDFGVPANLSKPLAVALPVAEILIALLLLFVQTSWLAAVFGFLLLAVFTGGMVVQMMKGNAPDCHCFGAIHSEPVSAKSLIRNAAFALLALILIAAGRERQGRGLFDATPGEASQGNYMEYILGLAIVGLLGGVVYLLKQISDQQLQIIRRIEILELTAGDGSGGGGKTVEREDVAHPESGRLIGSPAPDFVLPDLNGKQVSFESLLAKNKPMLFVFVSPTCNPCGALLPEIEAWQNELKDKIDFVFISSGKAKENAEKLGGKTFKQILLQKNREVAELFETQWTPTVLLINADGTIGSRPAAGDGAIRELIGKINEEIAAAGENNSFYIANGKKKSGAPVGEAVPDFALEDVSSGRQLKAEDLRGKKTLVAFWSVNCGYCTQMLDDLRDWDKTKGQDEPDLLLLSSGEKEKNLELDLKSPIVIDDKRELATKLGMNGTPSAILINEEGKISSEIAVGAQQIWTLLGRKK